MRRQLACAAALGLGFVCASVEGSVISEVAALEQAVRNEDADSIRSAQKDVEHLLKQYPELCDTRMDYYGDNCGVTLFDFAIENEIDFLFDSCMESGVNLRRDETLGCYTSVWLAYLRAIDGEDENRMDYLDRILKAGANVNEAQMLDDEDGSRYITYMLHDAIEQDDEEMVAMLLRYGADPTLPDSDGVTALQLAEDSNEKISSSIKHAKAS